MQYPKVPEAEQLNVLIQRSVESGIYHFYKGMEIFLTQLRQMEQSSHGIQQDQSVYITMDHIWIYVYGFVIANGLCTVVFFGEILYFHWNTILQCLRRCIAATRDAIRTIIIGLRDRMRRLFGRGIAALRRVMQRLKNSSVLSRMRAFLEPGIAASRRVMRGMRIRQTRVHPFRERA